MSQRVGRISRKVIYERGFDHAKRVVSYGIEPNLSADEFLESLATAQNYAQADADGRPVSLELVATVQHGWPVPLSFTLHFEVTPCAA